MDDFDHLIGKTLAEADDLTEQPIRVDREDGELLLRNGTAWFTFLYVDTVGGIITKINGVR